ncbi:MAG: endonuclease/exonuclease/phosphatase family protein [Chloroflexales bacterium]
MPARSLIIRSILLSSLLFALRLSAYTYLAALVIWFTTRLCFGDRWWWLFLLNVGAPYLFLPVPLILLGALLIRRGDLGLISGAALGLGLSLYGGLFLPRLPSAHAADGSLTVMTYNTLFHQTDSQAVVATLRASGADIIALQELNAPVAKAIREQLAGEYPYQVLEPQHSASGMGVISRYPLASTGERLPGRWVGPPQVLQVDYVGTDITFVNAHCISINLSPQAWREDLEQAAREREAQAQTLVEFAARRDTPLIIVGDFNTTDQTMAYRTLSGALHDAWRERGFGFGHTFPGPYPPSGYSPSRDSWPMPIWLARIDYIFYSDAWRTRSARTGPESGKSDHRPILAELALLTPAAP